MYAERDKINYFDLTNNNHSIVIEGLSGAVAVAYDMKDNYVYWADMIDHQIRRRTLNESGKCECSLSTNLLNTAECF